LTVAVVNNITECPNSDNPFANKSNEVSDPPNGCVYGVSKVNGWPLSINNIFINKFS